MQGIYIKSPILKIILGILASLAAIILILLVGVTEEVRMQDQTENWEARSIENGAVLFSNNCSSCHGPDGKGLPGVAPALNSHYFFTERIKDVGWAGSLKDYVALTVAAGRPSKTNTQWAQVMPTWGAEYGGPLRADQVEDVVAYVMNWEESALAQTAEEDPFQPFLDVSKPPELQTIAAEEGAEAPAAEAAAPSEGPREPSVLFTEMGCVGCHNLAEPQTTSNRGPVGPNLGNLYEHAGDRVPGQSAEEYVHNSIVNPSAYVVEGYMDGIMPQNFSEKMSEEEIQALVEWLLNPNREQ